MAKRKYTSPCYFCGGQACTDEHAPPKQMFKSFSCDSITVPSCEEHNSSKGGHDQAIVNAFLIPLHNEKNRYRLEKEILAAIKVAEPSFERTKRRAIDSPLLKNPSNSLKDLPNLVYLVPCIDIQAWVRQLTAAMIFDGTNNFDSKIKWSESKTWSPYWIAKDPSPIEPEQAKSILQKKRETEERLELLNWQDGWSARPRSYPSIIYFFQIHFKPNNEVILKHRFYNRYTWYVRFSASGETVSKLKNKITT